MTKQRGYPDRRGMGAQSDFIAEVFVPEERYKRQQRAMVEQLLATGVKAEQVAKMFLVPFDLLAAEKPDQARSFEKKAEPASTDEVVPLIA